MRQIKSYFIFILLLSLTNTVLPQELDIIPYLKQIEQGEIESVKNELPELKKKYPQSPNLLFLEGVLTENGQEAVTIYQVVADKFPKSEFADASLYRIYSYYYALGLYESAGKTLSKLQKEYPLSPYIKMAKSNKLPDETILKTENSDDDDGSIRFMIQAGAFTDYKNATSLLNDVKAAGFYAIAEEKIVGGTTFQVVYIGRFENRADAESMLKIINSRFNLNGRIVEFEETSKQ